MKLITRFKMTACAIMASASLIACSAATATGEAAGTASIDNTKAPGKFKVTVNIEEMAIPNQPVSIFTHNVDGSQAKWKATRNTIAKGKMKMGKVILEGEIEGARVAYLRYQTNYGAATTPIILEAGRLLHQRIQRFPICNWRQLQQIFLWRRFHGSI